MLSPVIIYMDISNLIFKYRGSQMNSWARCGANTEPSCLHFDVNSSSASGEFWRPLMAFANGLDPNEAQHNVRPNLISKLHRLICQQKERNFTFACKFGLPWRQYCSLLKSSA